MNNTKLVKYTLLAITLTSVIALAMITIFLILQGMKPFFATDFDLNIIDFFTGDTWKPNQGVYGIGYMIIGSILATLGSIILVVPVAILTSVAIVEFMPTKIAKPFTFAIELLAGIPSVLYGLFGLGVLVPLIRQVSPTGSGQSLLAVTLVLAMMVMPTVIALTVSSLKSVPNSYRHASLSLGADKLQTTFKVVVPAARSGIMAGIVLGIGRAIGETMAVTLVAGNVTGGVPGSIFDMIRPMTANIALEMGYATGHHRELLFTTGLVLFIFIMLLNIIATRLAKRGEMR
ncbi:phosphate ABC transporter permease subunit PstC [Mollicutes bacterium LVI A0039]|nr:phosphate ABC transporter permease subunit PstC [Mollicutes bacterium LVI A0039]